MGILFNSVGATVVVVYWLGWMMFLNKQSPGLTSDRITRVSPELGMRPDPRKTYGIQNAPNGLLG